MLQVLQICELFSQKHLNFTFDLVTPVPCLNHCHCYHRQDFSVNVYDCSQGQGFPINIPNNTDWLFCSNSHISTLPDDIPFMKNITNLNISNNNIQTISEKSLTALVNFRKLKTLDISKNNFSIIPKQFQHLVKLEAVYMANNSINCNCDMLWLVSWINNFVLPGGNRIVRGYETVTCFHTNKQIYKLTAVEMGCFPKELTSWQMAILGVGGGIIIFVVIAVIAVAKRWNEVKWFLFFHFNIRDKRDDDVNTLKGMKWDAMISFR